MSENRKERDRIYRNKRRGPDGDIASQIYNSQRWRNYRTWFRNHHPFCADPFGIHKAKNEYVITEQLHHIIKINDRPDLAFTESNIQPLCESCHIHVERGTKPTIILTRPVGYGQKRSEENTNVSPDKEGKLESEQPVDGSTPSGSARDTNP